MMTKNVFVLFSLIFVQSIASKEDIKDFYQFLNSQTNASIERMKISFDNFKQRRNPLSRFRERFNRFIDSIVNETNGNLDNNYKLEIERLEYKGTVHIPHTIQVENTIHYIRIGAQNADTFMVIAANVDTSPDSDGVNDNGSGCVALTQLFILLNEYLPSRSNFSIEIYFVFFDLTNYGYLGSEEFVNNYLINEINGRRRKFLGAIILHSLLKLNQTQGSQMIPPSYYEIHADSTMQYESDEQISEWLSYLTKIKENKHKGDFIAVYSRHSPDKQLFHFFNESLQFNLTHKTFLFRANIDHLLSNLNLVEYDAVVQGDHVSFWSPDLIFDHSKNFKPSRRTDYHFEYHLPAVLVTDTHWLRKDNWYCIGNPCDNEAQITDESLHFLYHSVKLVALTVFQMRNISTENVIALKRRARKPKFPFYLPKEVHLSPKFQKASVLLLACTGAALFFFACLYLLNYDTFSNETETSKTIETELNTRQIESLDDEIEHKKDK